MTPDELFRLVLDDMRRAIDAPIGKLDTLRLALSLRLLLFDSVSPLLHAVNREPRKIKVLFRVNSNVRVTVPTVRGHSSPQPHLKINFRISPLEPKSSGPIEELNLDQFFAVPVARLGRDTYSIHKVISQCAYVLGGVHLDRANTDERKALALLGESLRLFGQDPVISLLPHIAIVVLEALQPLRDMIDNEQNRPGQP